jgi:DNA-binding PadR family transcriptional regulator
MPKPSAIDPRDFLPLSTPVFHVLLSLADTPRHGYAIIVDVRERTGDEVRLTASTLYDALSRLVDQQLIEETGSPARDDASAARDDSRRRYYALTTLGRAVAEAEARRLERLLAMARAKKLLRR